MNSGIQSCSGVKTKVALISRFSPSVKHGRVVKLLSNVIGHPPRPNRNFTRLLQTAIGPRSGWNDSLASIALNGGQCFAFVYFSFLLFGCFVACSLQPRLAQGGKLALQYRLIFIGPQLPHTLQRVL